MTNPAFKTQDFWLAYECSFDDRLHRNASREYTQKWLNNLAIEYQVKQGTRTYIETPKQLRDIELNTSTTNYLEAQMTGSCSDYDDYDARFQQEKDARQHWPQFGLDKFEEQRLEYEETNLYFNFPLPRGAALALSLSVDLDENIIPFKDLHLSHSGQSYLVANWDDHCDNASLFKLQELDQLKLYLEKQKGWVGQGDIAWALLSHFAAPNNKKEATNLGQRYRDILNNINIETNKKFIFSGNMKWLETDLADEFVGVDIPDFLKNSSLDFDKKMIKSMSNSYRKQNYNNDPDYPNFPFELWHTLMCEI